MKNKSSSLLIPKYIIVFLFSILFCVDNTNAQYNFIAPSNPEDVIPNGPNQFANVSTAMIESPIAGVTISAITYSDFYNVYLYLVADNGLDTYGPFVVDNVSWGRPDVAIIDDPNPLIQGKQYRVAVAYTKYTGATPNAYTHCLKEFTVGISPTGFGTITGSGYWDRQTSVYTNIRIDAMLNDNASIFPIPNGFRTMDKYIVLHSDASNLTKVSILEPNLPAPTFSFTIPGDYRAYDIASSLDFSSGFGEQIAYVVVQDLNSNNEFYTIEYNTNTATINSATYLQTTMAYPDYLKNPRIEAFSIYEPTSPAYAKWGVALGDDYRQTMIYTDLNAPVGHLTNPWQYNPSVPDLCNATIAAGIGPLSNYPANIGNSQFSYAWPELGGSEFFAQSMDVNSNPINPSDVFIVNNASATIPTDVTDQISMSNSCNNGNGMVTAWSDGYDIKYKIELSNTYQFRPGQENTPKTIPSLVAIYPNPTQDYFIVNCGTQGEKVEIIDNLGKKVYSEKIYSEKTKIDVKNLSSGTYFVLLIDKNANINKQKLVI
ncbi:MAG TPA: T9SS type A sorting domain-containing protein, partial [Edaphocola sp.]|nr:T9SS type A sorting domain-containing protein [Edaphocola sp.]